MASLLSPHPSTLLSNPLPGRSANSTLLPLRLLTPAPSTTRPFSSRFKCSAGQTGFFTKLGRLIKEKAKSDVEKLFSGFSKTRDNLAVIDELLLYWNLSDTDRVLDELEEALLVSDFGPKITIKIVESLRDDIYAGKLKSGSEIKDALKRSVKPAVIMIVGVNGGGKTTSLGKLAHRLKQQGAKILMAAGDTFRAAASDQLEIWSERTGCEIVVAEKEQAKASSGRQRSWATWLMWIHISFFFHRPLKEGKNKALILSCVTLLDASLHTNYSLMEELISCKKAIAEIVPGAPNEILLVLDGTTGLNMLPQAREFNEVVGITGLILTKLDGSARGGCVVSVVDELGIPVKFVGVGEGVEDLQPFDAETFVDAIFS
ncbi:hypothetical protein RJ639_031634 [Escallonia herrerae]|uniref:SRP54-type proteins GTP-binding domain-containing protein n=1 Tax=Escallonia herrerae TaxID=1293975 RepID=A0AA88X9M8_9ASTE|nr:hypothetical protein RJ639_031634 [Escallonia herrerae]